MTRPRTFLRALVAALAGVLLLTGCDLDVYKLPLPGGTDVGDDAITVSADFRDVLDLVPKTTVKVNDVSVGQVTDIELHDGHAVVTMDLRNDVDLPANAIAEIRQTSLLGEKFVSLGPPTDVPPQGELADGAELTLGQTGRNPEVEEVLGALSLVLNGGGVAQLKTIAVEVNKALDGREGATRSVLDQIRVFMKQLDDNKSDIVTAIDSVNRLAKSVRDQQGSIDAALEELPSALTSLDKQRGDLVKMLRSLDQLSAVGVRVIDASKAGTIESLRQLNPVLTELANSGDAFVKSFNVFLTYPFVDEVVGRDPQVARNLHMGDYTNLSIQLDVDLSGGITGIPTKLPTLLPGDLEPTKVLDLLTRCLASGDLTSRPCTRLTGTLQGLTQLREACLKPANRDSAVCQALAQVPGLPAVPGLPLSQPSGAPSVPILGDLLGLGRADPDGTRPDDGTAQPGLRPRPRPPARPGDGEHPMITRRTRLQLLVFVAITLLGVSYVGARYARLDRVFFDDHYTVVAHLERSGGIYEGGEVSYRGVQVGSVGKLVLTDDGVDAYLDIDNADDKIPADTLAVVGNRSAVGEQYVELQPRTDDAPYLGEDSEIAMADTRTPIATEKFLGDISDTVESVDKDSLATTVDELGQAFAGTGADLQRIIDTGNSFINEADANFDTTTALIRDSNTVLQTQSDKASAIRTFAQQLSLFTGSLAGSDQDLREVIDQGSATANQLRTFLEDNRVDLAELLNNLVTTGDVIVKHLPGIEQILAIYPYVVEGGFTVVSKSPDTGLYDAHFGLILTNNPVCHRGYESTDTRPPQDGSNRPMNTKAGCTEPASQSNARGVQNLQRAGAAYRPPTVASYDPDSGRLRWGGRVSAASSQPGTLAPKSFGEDTWKWLFLQPLTESRK